MTWCHMETGVCKRKKRRHMETLAVFADTSNLWLTVYFEQVVLEHVDQLAGSENFERTILKFDENFSQLLISLLDKVMEFSQGSCEHKLMNILYR